MGKQAHEGAIRILTRVEDGHNIRFGGRYALFETYLVEQVLCATWHEICTAIV